MIIGIESSCDESALALFDPAIGLKGEWVHSQILKHQVYGGIVPDLASREHLDNFPGLLAKLLEDHQPGLGDTVAVTTGPGLAGCLALGIGFDHLRRFRDMVVGHGVCRESECHGCGGGNSGEVLHFILQLFSDTFNS